MQRPHSSPSQVAGRLAPGLRLATHNIRGFRAFGGLPAAHRARLLFSEWHRLNLHVVCVQEVQIAGADAEGRDEVRRVLQQAAAAAGAPGYKVFWGCRQQVQTTLVGDRPGRLRTGRGAASGGVAICIRRDLLRSQAIRLVGAAEADEDGRLMRMKLVWGGTAFTLVNVYLPSGDPSGQARFIDSRLGPLLREHSGPLVLAGDFNFTPDWQRDRALVAGVGSGGGLGHPASHRRDQRPAKAMRALATDLGLADAFRHKHPTRAAFTYICPTAASRIDRIYVSSVLLPHLLQCRVEGLSVSDHRPVVMHLAPLRPDGLGPGLKRVRLAFTRSEHLLKRLQRWVAEQAAVAPTGDDRAMLVWWPQFKRDLIGQVASLNRAYREWRAQARVEARAAEGQQRAAEAALETAPGVISQAALRAVVDARRRVVEASLLAEAVSVAASRRLAVTEGERPSPAITRIISRPASAQHVAALRTPAGGLEIDGGRMALMMARAFAAISARCLPDPVAVGRVLAAVEQHAGRIPAEAAAVAGEAVVDEEEVVAAVRFTKPGTAPGPDGLPPELWRHCGPAGAGLLAALFSAIGRTAATPRGFLDGVICPIFKAGDATLIANYRPICLLNTDYRLLAKCLAARVGPLLAKLVGPQQNAFIPGRCITANITFLQLLPQALRLQGKGAVLAFLDIRKAYDTVSRSFLAEVMDRVGAGSGWLRWVRTLLSGTYTAACVNGHASRPVLFEEGVRQGCPLAPALFLFAALALECWLRACPVAGVEVTPGQWVYAMQFADDTEVLLRDARPDTVCRFLQHMCVYERATGQALNPSKSRLLPVGDVSAFQPLPATVEGVPVVERAQALGVVLTNGGDPAASIDWQQRVAPVGKRFDRLAKLGLSAFGRAQCAGSYGVGRVLFHAGHTGMPGDTAQQMWSQAVDLADRGLGPGSRDRGRLRGVREECLVGRPSKGGFGLLPMRQHVRARHAALARQLIVWLAGDPSSLRRRGAPAGGGILPPRPLWVGLAAALLRDLCPAADPALALLAMAIPADYRPLDHLPGQNVCGRPSPGPLALMFEGLRALGPVREVAGEDLMGLPPDLVFQMPLWGNPILQLEFKATHRTARWPWDGMDLAATRNARAKAMREAQIAGFGPWVGTPALHTVRDLAVLAQHLRSLGARGLGGRAAVREVWGCGALLPSWVSYLFNTWSPTSPPGEQAVVVEVEAMLTALPIQWKVQVMRWAEGLQAAGSLPRLDPSIRHLDSTVSEPAVREIVQRLGWPGVALNRQAKDKQDRPLYPLSVRWATVLQLRRDGAFRTQRQARTLYVADALVGVGQPLTEDANTERAQDRLEAAMARLWCLPWENGRKETLWRLTVNGVPGAGGCDICLGGRCPCGWAGPPDGVTRSVGARSWRQHYFWECAVARVLVEHVQAALPGRQVLRRHLWLLQPPAGVHACVWEPVCAAVLEAMAFGRKLLWARHEERLPQPGQRCITQFFPVVRARQSPQPPPLHERVGRLAVAKFWELLQGLVTLDECPVKDRRWEAVPADHPFLSVTRVTGRPFRPLRFVLNMPGPQPVVGCLR